MIAARVGESEFMHAPWHVLDGGDGESCAYESGMPVIDVAGDDVAPGVIAGRVETGGKVEVADALFMVVHECETVLVVLDVKAGGLVEADRCGHVGHRQRWCHVDATGLCVEPSDVNPADLDVVMALQGAHHRRITFLPAAEALHTVRSYDARTSRSRRSCSTQSVGASNEEIGREYPSAV